MNGKFIALAAFALALVAIPVSASHLPDTGGNPVNVYSCERVSDGISIMHTASSTPTTLLSSCRDGGDAHGQLRQYTMSCTTRSQYFVSWKPCGTGTTEPSYIFNTFGVTFGLGFSASNIFEADSGYLRSNKQYWAKMAGDIPASWGSFYLNADTISRLSEGYTYAFAWTEKVATSGGSAYNSGTAFNENLAKVLVKNAQFTTNKNMTFIATDYYRGKMVTALVFARNNDGVSRVPNMPVEVDDVIAVHFYIPAKSSAEPRVETKPEVREEVKPETRPEVRSEVRPETVPIEPERNEPACSDVKGGDVTFLVCDEYAVDHYLSGAKIKVIEHDEEMAQVDLVGLNASEATLGKGETQIFSLRSDSAKYLKVTYLGSGQWGRALIKVQSNMGKNTPNECVNQTGGDGQYIVCAGKSLHNTGTNIKMLVTSVSKSSVFIKATGATNTYYNIKKGATKSIVQKVRGSTKFIKVTYKGLQGKKAILEIEEKGVDKIVAKPTVAQPTITQPTSRQVLTNYPRTASISWTVVEGAESYEVDVECDICQYPAWTSVYKFKSVSNTFTTEPLAGDNTFRVRVRAVYSNGTTSQYSDYVYFSYKTSSSSSNNIRVTFGVGVNNYPEFKDAKESVNLPNAFVNMYTVVLKDGRYSVTEVERKNTGTGFNPGASFTILPNQMVYFEGFKTEEGAKRAYESAKNNTFVAPPPYKNFGVDSTTLCQTNFANANELLNNSQAYACSTSLSTPYKD